MNTKISLSSMAMDLKRVALGYHRGSKAMAERFLEEAFKRRSELNLQTLDIYIRNILKNMEHLKTLDQEKSADDALMYSVLLQNYCQKKL